MNNPFLNIVVIAMIGCNSPSAVSLAQSRQSQQSANAVAVTSESTPRAAPPVIPTARRIFVNETDTIQASRVVALPAVAKGIDTCRLLSPNHNDSFRLTMISTTWGEYLNYKLPCGAEVWQNAATDLLWMNTDGFVRVLGEAMFKMGKTPVAIQIDDATIFCPPYSTVNVRRFPTDTTLTVASLRGKVRFSVSTGGISLHALHDVVYNFKGQFIHGNCDSAEVVAWTQGRIDSEKIRLSAVAATLSRWYDKAFFIQTKNQLKNVSIDWRFVEYDFPRVLKKLEEAYEVRCIDSGSTVVITDNN